MHRNIMKEWSLKVTVDTAWYEVSRRPWDRLGSGILNCSPYIWTNVSLIKRMDAFQLWCGRRLLRVPWAARRSNQAILKEIKHENSLEGLRLKLKLQYFGHLLHKADSLKKTLKLEKNWRQEKRKTEDEMVGWYHRLNGHEFEETLGDSGGQGSLTCCSPWGCRVRLI